MLKTKIKKFVAAKRRSKRQACGRLFFIHIPKTAGTSFRLSLEPNFEMVMDYGNNSNNTSPAVQQYSYVENDLCLLDNELNQKPSVCITGHTHLAKYLNFVAVENTITFLREPLEQVLSHYNHYVTHHGFSGDLNDFLDKPFAQNFQSQFVQALPLGLLGFVGLTEAYNQSIAMINKQYSLDLTIKKVNVNKSKQFFNSDLEDALHDKFVRLNQRDIALYAEAEFIHQQRVKMHDENKPWTYSHATIGDNNALHGCAFQLAGDQAVKLVVKINGDVRQVISAKHFYGGYVRANFPRNRFVGFNFQLPKRLTRADEIDLYVEGTGQKLNAVPLRVATQ